MSDLIYHDVTCLSDDDLYLFNEGNHFTLHDHLGAHVTHRKGIEGTNFAVWAPNATHVSVVGDFNGWNRDDHILRQRGTSGIWEGFIPHVGHGAVYKYLIKSNKSLYTQEKADPFGRWHETPPKTASIVWNDAYTWRDKEWMSTRQDTQSVHTAMSVYEVHPGSWRRVPEEDNRSLGWRELAHQLGAYVHEMGYTHVELMPVMEHPFYGSWGYQVTGYFAPTSRHGTPEDFKYFIDHMHGLGIGVFLDWVPSHFPDDAHGLALFDGTHLFEHEDPRQGFHPDWKSCIFNYARHEVRSFLISSAMFWLEEYHIDGLRVDGVASMLYLDYSRKEGEWIPNKYGGRENLGAIALFRRLNEAVYAKFPGVHTIAEESTAWPNVSRPTYVGGLGFGMKWDMGWMHDTLQYLTNDPIHRSFHHNEITFRAIYAFSENYMMSLSHDEVVHGKGSLVDKMPGDTWQKMANLRLLFGFMYGQPGKKLMFMGQEFAQWSEWNHDSSLDWHLLTHPMHSGVKHWVEDLNNALKEHAALHELDFDPKGFAWVNANDHEQSVLSFLRFDAHAKKPMLIVYNFTPVVRKHHQLGVPKAGYWREVLNSDSHLYGGSGVGNLGGVWSTHEERHGHADSVRLTLPPLGVLFLTPGQEQPFSLEQDEEE